MGPGPSQGDKKITSALTYEGTNRSHGEWAGQDCKAVARMAGNDPFCGRKVWSQTSKRLRLTCRRFPNRHLKTTGWEHIRAKAQVYPSRGCTAESLPVGF